MVPSRVADYVYKTNILLLSRVIEEGGSKTHLEGWVGRDGLKSYRLCFKRNFSFKFQHKSFEFPRSLIPLYVCFVSKEEYETCIYRRVDDVKRPTPPQGMQ